MSGKYVVEATRRVAGGVHLRPPINVSYQARTPHMGSLDTAPHRYLLSQPRPGRNRHLSSFLPALLVLGLAACRVAKQLVHDITDNCDDRHQFDHRWQESGDNYTQQNNRHHDGSCAGGEIEIAGTIGAAAFQTGAIYRDMPDRGDGAYSPVLRFPSWPRADPAGVLPLPVPLPMPLDAPEQGQSLDDLTAEDRTSLQSDPAPLMPHQPAPILAILAPVQPPRDQMPADVSPPIDQKPPILSPDLVQPRPALFPVPIQMPIQTPRHRTPRNQSLILLAPVIMPHMTAR